MAAVYSINKGVSRPIVFKGFKAQYIAYLCTGMVLLLILFAVLYISRVPLFLLLPLILGSATALYLFTYRLSHRFGEYGLMKYLAKRSMPSGIAFRSRRVFTALKYTITITQTN